VRLVGGPLLRLRSDEQLVRLFRGGSEEAFRVVHDRYRARLLAYARQMLGGAGADAEDVLQDVFVRAYAALRANDRDVSLRAWLYRIAHNRCIDELRRPGGGGANASDEALELAHARSGDPHATAEQRESLRRLVADVQRLPEQQRSALLMREISGMAYQDLAGALDVTVPAVKSLLVRARIGLAQAAEARDTACAAIRADLADAHERGVRASGIARRHMHDCGSCRAYRRELRVIDAHLAALVPVLGPVALIANLLGIGSGGAAAGGGAGAAGGATAAGAGVAATGVGIGAGVTAGAGTAGLSVGHIAAAVAVAVVGAGGAVEVHGTLTPHATPAAIHRVVSVAATPPLLVPPVAVGAVTSGAAVDESDEASALQLQIATPVETEVAPPPPLDAGTDPSDEALAGGVAAPVDPTLDPVATQPPADEGAVSGDEGAGGGTASGSSEAMPEPPPDAAPPAEPAPATSVAPSPAPASTAPPSSATTGGATYSPPR